MKSFLLMSAAWLSGAAGDATPVPGPAPAPIVSPAPIATPAPAPIISSAPTGACCGNSAPQTYHPAPTFTGAPVQTVVSGGITGNCACDPCAQAAPAAAPAPSGPRHLLHRLFGKKEAAAPAPAATSPVVGSCGCEATPAAAAPAKSGGFISRVFGSKPAPAPAPIYTGSTGTVISSTPCTNCGSAPVPGTVIHPHTAIQPGATLPTIVGTPTVPGTTTQPSTTPAVEKPAPLPKGPEKIEEAPKEPKKLPSDTSRGFQPASGTQVESGGRLPF